MENVEYPVVNQSGKEVGKVTLRGDVFNGSVLEDIVHATVVWQQAKKRAGTHKALRKGEMLASGKKPWKQKGTGRARAGTTTSPVWVGGASAHGPLPRSYETRLSKRARKQALVSVLTSKRLNNEIIVVDSLDVKEAKTKQCVSLLKSLGVNNSKTLLLSDKQDSAILRGSRNIAKVTTTSVDGVNVYSLINNKNLVISKAGVEALQQKVAKD